MNTSPSSKPPASTAPAGVPRRSRRRVWLRRVGLTIVALVVLIALFLGWLLATPSGARWLFARVGAFVPGTLVVEHLRGPIRGPLTIDGLRWDNEGMRVTVEQVTLEWRLRALLRRQLDIQSLEAEGIRVMTASTDDTVDEPTVLPDVHLPINIIVRQARVRDIQIMSDAEQPPLGINSIDLATRTQGDLVTIETLNVDAPTFRFDVAGSVEPVGDYAVDLQTTWSVQPAVDEGAGSASTDTASTDTASTTASTKTATWAGSGRLSGTLASLQVVQQVTAPLTVQVDATVTQPLRDLALDGTINAEPFPLAVLDPSLPELTVGGMVTARGAIDQLTAQIDLGIEGPDVGALAVTGEIARDGTVGRASSPADQYTFETLTITTPGTDRRVVLNGTATLATGEAPRFDMDASWTDVVWPLVGEPVAQSPTGTATVAGTTEGYDLILDAMVEGGGLPASPLAVEGRGTTERMTLARVEAGLLDGTVTAQGEVAWAPQVTWNLDVVGDEIDPRSVWPDGEGRLAIRASTTGTVEASGPVGQAVVQSLQGVVRGSPFDANATVDLAGERVSVSDLALTWGEQDNAGAATGAIRLTADGLVAPALDLDFALRVPNLGLALPDAGGTVVVDGEVQGPTSTPRLVVTADGENLVYGDWVAKNLTVQGDVDLAAGGAWDLATELRSVVLGTTPIEQLTLALDGQRDQHRLTIVAEGLGHDERGESGTETGADTGRLRVVLDGGLDAQTQWQGAWTTLDATVPGAGAWTLARPASLAASSVEASLEPLCMVSGDARLCVDGAWRAADEARAAVGGWDANATLDAIPLALAALVLPPDVSITGTIGGTARARTTDTGAIVAQADLAPGPGTVDYPVPEGGRDTVRFDRGELTADAGTDGLMARFTLPLPDLGSAAGTLTLPGAVLGAMGDDQMIDGRLEANIDDLSFLQAFTDQVESTAGRVVADIAIRGTLGQPRIGGQASLEDGRASIPGLGIDLTEMTLTARGDDEAGMGDGIDTTNDAGQWGLLRLDGSVRSGDGTLTLEGIAPPVPSGDDPLRLTIRGEAFTAMNTPEVLVSASPDLALTFDGETLGLTGDVVIPEATIEIKKAATGTVVVSSDVVYVGRDPVPAADAAGLPLAMRVRGILGDEVEIEALGLTAEPTGSLLLVDEPGQVTYGTGQIDVSGGTFKAYGQDLQIERGRLIFSGPIDTPRIDIRAYREAKDGVIAGLEARGTLAAPEISLWSEPTMPQADQLSYILLGRPLDQASESDGNLMANAAASLGIKGGNLLAERLAARFGLEEARIETDGGLDEASLVLGKYLTPRLYVAYGVGLFEAANTMRIRYLLSSKWTLEATAGETSGADLLYTIERGRGAKRRVAPIKGIKVPEGPDGVPPGTEGGS